MTTISRTFFFLSESDAITISSYKGSIDFQAHFGNITCCCPKTGKVYYSNRIEQLAWEQQNRFSLRIPAFADPLKVEITGTFNVALIRFGFETSVDQS